MKIKYNEEFEHGTQKRKIHFKRHVKNNKNEFSIKSYPDAVSYEQGADTLANTPIGNTVVGYIGFLGDTEEYHKYNNKTQELVIYAKDNTYHTGNHVITYYKASNTKYERLLNSKIARWNRDPDKIIYYDSIKIL